MLQEGLPYCRNFNRDPITGFALSHTQCPIYQRQLPSSVTSTPPPPFNLTTVLILHSKDKKFTKAFLRDTIPCRLADGELSA